MQEKSTKKSSWQFQSGKGFVIGLGDDQLPLIENNSLSITITYKNGKLFLDDQKVMSPTLIITAPSDIILFNGKEYTGSLVIKREKKKVIIAHQYMSEASTAEPKSIQTKPIKQAPQKVNDFTVRVLIDEQDVPSLSWTLRSEKGFVLCNPLKPSKKQTIDSSEITVTACTKGFIYVNEQRLYNLQAYITPIEGAIEFNGKEYGGGFWLLADGTSNKLINCLGIEDYVTCVLTTESWPGWSLEVNKVLAIACRTYVISMVQNARIMKRPYHVRNTNKHQTYGGGNGLDIHRKAVEQTHGLFLSYRSQPITAMFDGCCGGLVTKHMHGVDFKKAPYLARSYPCIYCKKFKIHSWQGKYDLHELEKALKVALPGLRRLREIKITKKDKAGIIQQVQIKGAGHTYNLSGKKIYSLLNSKVKSFHFSIEKVENIVTFKGKGYGHHLGLCQWGAKEMINQGYDYKSVLEFYYPGTQLMRLI